MELVRYKNTLQQNETWDSTVEWKALIEDAQQAIEDACRSVLSARTKINHFELRLMEVENGNEYFH